MPLNIEFKRGDVVRVKFDPIVGSEQAGERPALVISPDKFNLYSPVVMVASITSKKTDRVFSFETLLDANEGGLPLRSKVMLAHVRTIDKSRIVGQYGTLNASEMIRVDNALKIATGLK